MKVAMKSDHFDDLMEAQRVIRRWIKAGQERRFLRVDVNGGEAVSGCGCGCVYVGYDGTCDFYTESVRTARKEHRCGECQRVIAPGERYESFTGGWEGSIRTHKTCADCLSVRDEFFCEGHVFGNLWNDLRFHWYDSGDIDVCCLDRLTQAARIRAVALIDDLMDGWEDL